MVANAFGLPPLMLGLEADVNQSTASEMADEAFRGAISPLAVLLAGHITRDLFGNASAGGEFEFVFNATQRARRADGMQVQVATAAGRRADSERGAGQRGLGPLEQAAKQQISGSASQQAGALAT